MRIATFALLLGTAFAASADDTASTKAPRVVELKPDDRGRIRVTAMRNGCLSRVAAMPDGKAGFKVQSIRVQEEVEIERVKELKFYDTTGKAVSKADALKALTKGGKVVISSDGKRVAPEFLMTVPAGTLVLVAPDLVLERDYYGRWVLEP